MAQRDRPHQKGVHHLLPVVPKALVEIRSGVGKLGKSIEIPSQQILLPFPPVVRRKRRRNGVSDVARPVATRQALPIAQTHSACRSPIPVPNVHVGMDQPLPLAFVDCESTHRRRPDRIALRQNLFRNDLSRSIERLSGIVFQAHLLGANGKPSRIAREPPIPRRKFAISVKAGMQRSQQVDHPFRHRTSDGRAAIAEARRLRRHEIFQQQDRRERPAVKRGVITNGRLDIELRPELRKKTALNSRRTVEAPDHARHHTR